MFIIFLTFFAIASVFGADYETRTHRLEVPEDPDKWVFKGNDSSHSHGRGGGRISRGQTATDTQFPWAAQMGINLQNGGYRCTGSLIKANWIVSARHCIADTNAVSVQAQLGSADDQKFRVKIFSDLFVWMNVNIGEAPDIALFRLTNDLALNSYVNTVRIPSRAQENFKFEGYTITACGWGGDGSGGLARQLQWTTFKVLYERDCNLGPNLICSQPPSGQSSLEGGDSGGPSVIYENGTPTLVGINVVVVTSGSNKWQGSTRVSSFLNFISDVTGLQIRSY
ncbi:hypothetical protein PVAND_015014 [Polypedilum vanderplanki]|uniref:Peptidase S1 domain-containing protein n=1 Tax=Polypedilum vanderplanki TaxID=319348 RepID=A0A9J6BBT9_POLVA|nr:hypothetical protein PVAND_015014 [Polypedilum vanderplanki]